MPLSEIADMGKKQAFITTNAKLLISNHPFPYWLVSFIYLDIGVLLESLDQCLIFSTWLLYFQGGNGHNSWL